VRGLALDKLDARNAANNELDATMTLTQMITYCSDLLDDPNNTYFTTTNLTLRLNLALRELQKRLISANEQWYMTCVTAPTVISQSAYALPSDFMQVIRLDYITQGSGTTATTQKLLPITPNQVDMITDVSGDPQFYVLQKDQFVLYPTPTSVKTLHLYYSYYVADMVSGSDTPDAPAQFHEYIAILAARDCYIKDGRPITPIEQKLQEYEKLLKEVAVQREASVARMVTKTNYLDWD
jgi:hypothetical protein